MKSHLTEEELSDRISLFFEVIDSISEEYYPEMLSEEYDSISEDYQETFQDIIEFFIDEVNYESPEMNEELSETLAELVLSETIGDVIAKFSGHARRERSADTAAKEYKRIAARTKGSSKKDYKDWKNQKTTAAERLYGDAREQKSYHGKKRAELAAKIDRNVSRFAAHPVVHTGRAIVNGTIGATKLAAKGAAGAAKVLAKGIHRVLTTNLRKRHSLFQDRKYERRLPRLRTVQKSSPNIKKTN